MPAFQVCPKNRYECSGYFFRATSLLLKSLIWDISFLMIASIFVFPRAKPAGLHYKDKPE